MPALNMSLVTISRVIDAITFHAMAPILIHLELRFERGDRTSRDPPQVKPFRRRLRCVTAPATAGIASGCAPLVVRACLPVVAWSPSSLQARP